MLDTIDVVILCGGLGIRLRKVIKDVPKPMAGIMGRPFLDILIEYARGYGFKRFILCTGYKNRVIEDYYSSSLDKKILISHERNQLGTAGALINASRIIKSDTFLVMNGDSFCPVDLNKFYKFHTKKKALVSMVACKAFGKTSDYGTMAFNKSYKILRFGEKENKKFPYINGGIYFFNKKIFSLIAGHRKFSLEYGLFPKILGSAFYAYIVKRRLIDIGTPERYAYAQKYFSKRHMV